MSLLFRLGIYLPVLFLIAVVVCSQHHVTARETIKEAVPRAGRWALYSAGLVAVILAIEWLFID